MILGLILIGAGFVLVFLEFFLPGGIVGIAGAVTTLVGLVIFGIYSPSGLLTAGVVIATLVLFAVMARFALRRIKGMGKMGTIYLDSDQEGFKASSFKQELIGERGVALTDLHPSGHVQIRNQRWQAVAKVGYLQKGTQVVVIGGEGAHLVVRKEEKE